MATKTIQKSIRSGNAVAAATEQETHLLLRAALKTLEEHKKYLKDLKPGTYELRNKTVTIELEAVKVKQGEPFDKAAAAPLPWNQLIAFLLLKFSAAKRQEVLKEIGDVLDKCVDGGINVSEVLEAELELRPTILAWQMMLKEKAGTVEQRGACAITVMGANFKVGDLAVTH